MSAPDDVAPATRLSRVPLRITLVALLELFLLNPRQVMTRDVIFQRVWGYDFEPGSNTIEVYVSYLRRKLDTTEPRLLHTIRGVGYTLRLPRGA